jgi:hypothetical protein
VFRPCLLRQARLVHSRRPKMTSPASRAQRDDPLVMLVAVQSLSGDAVTKVDRKLSK